MSVDAILSRHFGGPEWSKPSTEDMARAVSLRLEQLSRELMLMGVDSATIPWEGEGGGAGDGEPGSGRRATPSMPKSGIEPA